MLKVLVNRMTGKEKVYEVENRQHTNQALVDNFVDPALDEGFTANHWYSSHLFASYGTAIGYRFCNILLVTDEKYSRTTSAIQNKLERAFATTETNFKGQLFPHKVYKVPQGIINHFAFDDYEFLEVYDFLVDCVKDGKNELDFSDYKYILSL